MLKFCFHSISWEQIDKFWSNLFWICIHIAKFRKGPLSIIFHQYLTVMALDWNQNFVSVEYFVNWSNFECKYRFRLFVNYLQSYYWPGFNCWFSIAPVFQWCCSTPQGSPGVGRNTVLSSPHLSFITVFICDLFVSRDDPLMRWVGRQTQWWPRHKAIYFRWFGPELFCLLLGPPGFNCWFSSAPVFQWCCLTPQGSPGVGRNTFLSSPHLCFIIVFICDLFVSRDDSLMS